MKISVINMKGGVGKTILSQTVAQHPMIDANIITNDPYTALELLYEEDVIVEKDTNKILSSLDSEGDIVFDFGGFIDKNILEILNKSDIVIVPMTSHFDTIKASIETLQEINIPKDKLIIVDNMSTNDSLVETAVVDYLGNGYDIVKFRSSKLFENAKSESAYITEYSTKNKINEYLYRNVIEDIENLVSSIIMKKEILKERNK
jgi:cellulose biosynthesis protein BcsQ